MEPTKDEVIARLEEIIHDIHVGRRTLETHEEIDWQQMTTSQLLDLLSLLGLQVY